MHYNVDWDSDWFSSGLPKYDIFFAHHNTYYLQTVPQIIGNNASLSSFAYFKYFAESWNKQIILPVYGCFATWHAQ